MENEEGVASSGGVGAGLADVSHLPWWRRPPMPAIVAVLVVVGFVYWMAGDEAFERSDLDLLPKDSSFILVVNVDEVYNSDLGEVIREAFRDQIREIEQKAREEAGFSVEDVSHFVIAGNASSSDPVVIIAFKDALDDERITQFARSLRVRDSEAREVGGYRVWGSDSDRMAMLEIRDGTYLIAGRKAVDHALAVLDDGGTNELADLMDDHDLFDAPMAAAFDWRALRGLSRDFDRELRGIAPSMAKHVGPILARSDIDDGIAAQWMLLDADNDIVLRSRTEIDGDFLEDVVRDLARWADQRMTPPEEPSAVSGWPGRGR